MQHTVYFPLYTSHTLTICGTNMPHELNPFLQYDECNERDNLSKPLSLT